VVIPTRNRQELLLETLGALSRQTLPAERFEVVVVCDGCDDGTYETLRNLATPYRLRALEQPRSGQGAARNQALSRVTARVVLFLDDDIAAVPELVAEHLRVHGGQDDGVVIGSLLPDPAVRSPGWIRFEHRILEDRYRAMQRGEIPVDGRKFYSGNVSIGRRLLAVAGGFNLKYGRAEDIEMGYRLQKLGAKFFFNHRAAAVHRGVHPFRSWSETQYRYGRLDVQLAAGEAYADLIPFARWYRRSHVLNRVLCRLAVGRPHLRLGFLRMARLTGLLADRLRLGLASRWSYSAIASLQYWQGVADELGASQELWRLVRPVGMTPSRV
jgi:glycosyltransferase involved in cell wall biosynthesis